MTLPAIQKPSERSINTCWKKWKREEKTDPQEKVLHSLFKERCPENTKSFQRSLMRSNDIMVWNPAFVK